MILDARVLERVIATIGALESVGLEAQQAGGHTGEPQNVLSMRLVPRSLPSPPASKPSVIAPANGRIERIEHGWLWGWAHGEGHAQARVEARKAGRIAFAWPAVCPRRDLWPEGDGPGTHGFRMPLAALLGVRNVEDTTLLIAGTGFALPIPQHEAASTGPSPRWQGAAPYPDAGTARQALLSALRPDLTDHGAAVLAFGFLQDILNRLSVAEAAAATRSELDRLAVLRRHVRAPTPLGSADPGLAGNPAEQVLLALITAAPGLRSQELASLVTSRLLPAFLAAPRMARTGLIATLMRHGPASLLLTFGRALQKAGFLEVPGDAMERGLTLQEGTPSFAQAQMLAETRSMARLARREPALPKPAILSRHGRRRLYALWRAVPHDTNGYATRSHYLLRALRTAGEDVVALTRLGYPWDIPSRPHDVAAEEMIDGVAYLHLGGAAFNRTAMTTGAYIRDCAERIAMVAVASGAGIIHAASNWMIALPALHAARLIGVPFCYEVRGLWEITRASHSPDYKGTEHYALFERMEGLLAREADLTFAITNGVRQELARRGADPARIRIAPNGCDTSVFVPGPCDRELAAQLGTRGQCVFGYIGTFVHYEGLLDLCHAAVMLHRKGLDFRLLLVGDGPFAPVVEDFCRSQDHGGKILLAGRVRFQDVPRYYSLVDIAVFPRKSFEVTEMVSPLKPFEAMAMGKPVIASDVAAMAEFVRHGETGWLFPKGDVAALAATMEAALATPNRAALLSEAARRFVVDRHDWSTVAQRIAAGWHDVATGAHLPKGSPI